MTPEGIRSAIMLVGIVALTAIVAGCVVAMFGKLAERILAISGIRKIGVIGAIAIAVAYGGSKKPQLTVDDYIADNDSIFDTNTWQTVYFRWTITNPAMPLTEPLHISSQPLDVVGAPWTDEATTQAGLLAYDLQKSNATNYRYWLWHDWMPPTPVHTNGVWVGTIVERAKDDATNKKLVIVNGYIQENGVKITPRRDAE